jgi:hypothetical protein
MASLASMRTGVAFCLGVVLATGLAAAVGIATSGDQAAALALQSVGLDFGGSHTLKVTGSPQPSCGAGAMTLAFMPRNNGGDRALVISLESLSSGKPKVLDSREISTDQLKDGRSVLLKVKSGMRRQPVALLVCGKSGNDGCGDADANGQLAALGNDQLYFAAFGTVGPTGFEFSRVPAIGPDLRSNLEALLGSLSLSSGAAQDAAQWLERTQLRLANAPLTYGASGTVGVPVPHVEPMLCYNVQSLSKDGLKMPAMPQAPKAPAMPAMPPPGSKG